MGDAAEMLLLYPNGKVEKIILGSDLSKGEKLQVVVPAETWQGVRLREQSKSWSLMGTTVSPGFEFADCELGDRASLQKEYPSAKDLISRFTRLDGE
jgi:predicted cupin superfamily sugar epimerase